jgi:TIR domain
MALLERKGLITSWYDCDIDAGKNWENEIAIHLNRADIILLLVSPDFIASDYCYNLEMMRALERHEAGEASIIPIILRPASWKETPFGKLQALPEGGKALTTWSNRDEAFLQVADGIRKVVEQLNEKKSS